MQLTSCNPALTTTLVMSSSKTQELFKSLHIRHNKAIKSKMCDAKKHELKPRNVLHWFHSKDLRAQDNRALYASSQQAQGCGSVLISCFLFESLNTPLVILTAEERNQKGDKIIEFVKEHDISHMYANLKYEVDELRRDLGLFDRVEAGGDVRLDLKSRSEEERDRIRDFWPAGHEAGMKPMREFPTRNSGYTCAKTRSALAEDNSSHLSPHFAAGVTFVREGLSTARKHSNDSSAEFSSSGADMGLASWVREIMLREFYRHTMIVMLRESMNLPQNLKFDFADTTGVPFIDADMRQLRKEAYLHNRLRMNTVFNSALQAGEGGSYRDYIRKYVSELKEVMEKAIFYPFNRLARDKFKKLDYPEPNVDSKESKERCL
ncbi:deoxyribodipyrimidine photo-lyase [Xylaria sp. FL1777]|nr:deoxyribodipyrimidine photo-lyase [Xylaria sp. FL1777]